MTKNQPNKILNEVLINSNFKSNKKYKLIMLLGLLGDFDSFEYGINIASLMKSGNKISDLDVFAIGIGTLKGKNKFCRFTGFPENKLLVVNDNQIHKLLGANEGLNINMGGWANMLLMLSGINSLKTLKEVLRGYTGDKDSNQIYKDSDRINLFNFFNFSGELFKISFGNGYLRPFELATFRLCNMIEIINNWNDYILDTKYLPQRGATFLLDSENNTLYEYFPKDILSYSNRMGSPLGFLSDHLLQ